MESQISPIRRILSTVLAVFIGVGLGLIGPASALAQGVERGLNFTIVSDDIGKTAAGSVPAVPASSGGSDPTASGDGAAAASGGSGGGGSTPPPDPTDSDGSAGSGDAPAADSDAEAPAEAPAEPSGGGGDYTSSQDFSDKNKSNKAAGNNKKKKAAYKSK